MAKYTLGYSDLYDEVSWFLGLTSRGTSPTGTNLTTCTSIVARGIRQFMYPLDERGNPYNWNFLKFPWTFKVEPNDWKVALPVDFADVCSDLYYDINSANPPVKKRSAQQIIEYRTGNDISGYPECFAITPSKYDITYGTLYEMWLWPKANQSYDLTAFYRADPVKLSATTDLVFGGIRAIEAVLESCLAVAEHQEDDMQTSHHQSKARELVLTLIKFDRIADTDKLGNLHHPDMSWPPSRGYFTYPDTDNNVYPS